MWNSLSVLGLRQKKNPKSLNICWSLNFSLHPSPSCKIKAEASSSRLALEMSPATLLLFWFSGRRPSVPCCSSIKRTQPLADLAWQLHRIWVHWVIYRACWYTAAWFRSAKNPGMHQKAIYALLIIIIIKINVSPKWLWWPLPLHLTF